VLKNGVKEQIEVINGLLKQADVVISLNPL